MKFALILALTLGLSTLSCAKKAKTVTVDYNNPQSKFSYAIGQDIGSQIKQMKSMIDLPTLMKGIEDQLSDKPSLLKPEEAEQARREGFMKVQEEQSKGAGEAEEKFMADNKTKPGVVTTASGLQYIVMREGKGPKPTADKTVSVHYKGTLLDGKEFDNSYSRGQPVEFPVGGVIPGWTEALLLMNAGSQYKLFIPSTLGYGDRGTPGGPIPPGATLIFEVELLSIKN